MSGCDHCERLIMSGITYVEIDPRTARVTLSNYASLYVSPPTDGEDEVHLSFTREEGNGWYFDHEDIDELIFILKAIKSYIRPFECTQSPAGKLVSHLNGRKEVEEE